MLVMTGTEPSGVWVVLGLLRKGFRVWVVSGLWGRVEGEVGGAAGGEPGALEGCLGLVVCAQVSAPEGVLGG